jgi:hypothetical protein
MLAQKHPYRALLGVLVLLFGAAPLLACQPLQPVVAPTAAPGVPTEQPLAPLEPIIYAEGACIDFGVYPADTRLSPPFTLNDLRLDNLGDPSDNFPMVNNLGDRLGLQFAPAGLRIDFAAPATLVTLEVGAFSGQPVVVEVLATDGTLLTDQEVTPDEGIVTLSFTETEMQALQVQGGGFEGVLYSLCADQTIDVLSLVEIAIPYPPGITPPIGDAELVPGYPPMREAVAALAEQIWEAGVQINTARTVLLKESALALPNQDDNEGTESVAVAPIGPLGRDYANTEEQNRRMAEGLVIGVLLMETDIPDNLLTSGAYLVQVQRKDREGFVRLLDANLDVAAEVPLVAAFYPENQLQAPIAAIYQGTKYCVSCYNSGWCDCYPCSFWQILWCAGANQCPALLNQ